MSQAAIGPEPRHRWFAAVYDRMSKMDDKKMLPIRKHVAGGASGRVLELGCGTGLNLEHYDWDRVEALEATEPDPYMLRRADTRRTSLPSAVQSKLKLSLVPAERLPFDDASFDTVVCTLVLCTVLDPSKALSELYRVLKPGGEIRLFEHIHGSGTTAMVQRLIQPVYGWTAGGCQLSRDTETAIRDAGFSLDVTQRASLGPLWPAFIGVAKKGA